MSRQDNATVALDAERAVLGAVLSGGQFAVDEALTAQLDGTDFAKRAHGIIWEAAVALVDAGDAVSAVTICDHLVSKGKLGDAGGTAAIAALESGASSVAVLQPAVRAVMEAASLRRIAEAGALIARAAVARDEPADVLLRKAQEVFFGLERHRQRSVVADRMATVQAVMDQVGKTTAKGLPLGWRTLDGGILNRGLRRGQFIVVGARPSMGKTVFGHQLAQHVADEGVPAAFFSLEMTPDELIEREIAVAAKLPTDKWPASLGRPRLHQAAAHVAERALHLVHCPGASISTIASNARRLVAREGVGLIVVDYLGLVGGTGAYKGQRTQEVGEVSRALKALAGELMVPVVALAQLNRGVEGRVEKRPQLSDLRDSGEIEQDCDIVMFLHRPDYYLREKTPADLENICEVVVAKQRNGPTGVARLWSQLDQTRFRDIEEDGAR